MAHLHSVYDSDTRFEINPITRKIKNESSSKTTLMQGDHNSESFTFGLPRHVEGHDMSLCNKVEVHFFNIDSKTKEAKSGVYTAEDFQVDPEDESKVVFSWLISGNATKLSGLLKFRIRYRCVEDDITTYAWNTAFFDGISIGEGEDAAELLETEYVDVIEQWKASVVRGFEDDLRLAAAEVKGDVSAWKEAETANVRAEMTAFSRQWNATLDVERARIDNLIAVKYDPGRDEYHADLDAEYSTLDIISNGTMAYFILRDYSPLNVGEKREYHIPVSFSPFIGYGEERKDAGYKVRFDLYSVYDDDDNVIDVIAKVENLGTALADEIDFEFEYTLEVVRIPEELADIRVDASGRTHNTAGAAIRSQVEGLDAKIDSSVAACESANQAIADRVTELEENGGGDTPEGIVCVTRESVNIFDGDWEAAVLNSDGTTKESSNYITNANYAKVEPGKYLAVTCQKTATSPLRKVYGIYKYAFVDSEYNLVSYAANPTTETILVPDGSCYVKLSVYKGNPSIGELKPMFELLDSDDTSTIASEYADYSDAGGTLYYGFVTDKTVNAAQYTIGDGIADDTKGLQKALDIAAGGELFIPKGTYKVSGTLFIHENTVVRGSGASTIIQLAPNYSLTKTEWRETGGKWPIVTTDPGKVKTTNENGETTVVDAASHITVRDIAIYGDETAYHLKSQIGLQIRSNDSLVENVFVKNINYFPKEFPERTEMGGDNAPGYGIAVMYCDRVNVTGCICNGNGYEGIGTESCNDVVISNCFVGDGNRTGIQVHRGSHNVTIANCTVNNINTLKDADITMHGHVDNPITDVKIIGCTIKGGGDLKGAIELVAGAEHDVVISSCNIESSASAIYNEGFKNFYDKGGSIIVKGNVFKSAGDGLRLYSDYVVCTDNVINSATTALRTKSKVEAIVANNIFVNDSDHQSDTTPPPTT